VPAAAEAEQDGAPADDETDSDDDDASAAPERNGRVSAATRGKIYAPEARTESTALISWSRYEGNDPAGLARVS